GTEATLYFDLIGFGDSDSYVVLDDVRLLSGEIPTLEFALDPASDSGMAGDDLTNVQSVDFVGLTNPSTTVQLDVAADGIIDAVVDSDASGAFAFNGVALGDGPNTIRVAIDGLQATRTIGLDQQSPLGTLTEPVAGLFADTDPGYVEIEWSGGDLLTTTIGVDDVAITGVTIDSVEILSDGRVRYHYADDGDALPEGTVNVEAAAGAVTDVVGNPSNPLASSFGLDRQRPAGSVINPLPDTTINSDTGYVDVLWNDLGAAGLDPDSIDPSDVTVTGVTVARVETLVSGATRYWYGDNGDMLPEGTINVVLVGDAVSDRAGNRSASLTQSFSVDRFGPIAELVSPSPSSATHQDVSYVDVQWSDPGVAGIDFSTVGPDDVTIAGVTIDRVSELGGGVYRYWYGDDGDVLSDGVIAVNVIAGAVSDLIGNTNARLTESFILDRQMPVVEIEEPLASVTGTDTGNLILHWIDRGPAGVDRSTFGTDDVQIEGVTIDRFRFLGNDYVQYIYGDDGDTLADGTIAITISAGAVTDRAGNSVTTTSLSFELDRRGPIVNSITPPTASVVSADTGYVVLQWNDVGGAGLDANSIDADDVTVGGASIDRAEDLGGGHVRYWYNDDGETLSDGVVDVTFVAGQVADLAGNVNAAGSSSFTLDTQPPTPALISPTPRSTVSDQPGYFDVRWTDLGLAEIDYGTVGTDDLTVAGVSIDAIETLANGDVRYYYDLDGDEIPSGDVQVSFAADAVADRAGNLNAAASASFTLESEVADPVRVTD
ncbi:Ig-like domain-containing protein, partial [Stieleria sp.]|uniref:Ig-like domain-containing protein n=1 Tax=Stieleria sp. TaxID=2795976 RepID=UPI003568E17C